MNGDERKLWSAMNAIVQKQAEMIAGTDKVTAASQKAGAAQEEAFGDKAISSAAKMAAGIVSIASAVNIASNKYESWVRNIREISEASSDAMKQLTALAAMQEGGTKGARAEQAAALAAN